MAVSGWFSSCATDAVISPINATRFKCDISSRWICNCRSACFCALISIVTPMSLEKISVLVLQAPSADDDPACLAVRQNQRCSDSKNPSEAQA